MATSGHFPLSHLAREEEPKTADSQATASLVSVGKCVILLMHMHKMHLLLLVATLLVSICLYYQIYIRANHGVVCMHVYVRS